MDNTLGLLFQIDADPSRAEAALNRLQGSVGQAAKAQAAQFDSLAQVASAAFDRMAGSAQGAGGLMLQAFGQVADSILHQIDLQQLAASETQKTEAAKSAAAIEGIKQVAVVRAIQETAEGFAALASLQFGQAAQHFLAAAKFGAITAAEVAPLIGAASAHSAHSVQGPSRTASAAPGVAPGPLAALAPGAAGAANPPGGNVTVMVMGESQAAAWMTRVINQGVLQNDQMLIASHTKRSAPAGR